jgi:high affinity sulfate transporter 1
MTNRASKLSKLLFILPKSKWISEYQPGFFKWDLFAGITLASFILPESMAYATLAGIPSEYGIYSCIAGGLLFSLFTNARHVAIGPTSAISLMVGTSAAAMSGGDPGKWVSIVSLTAFLIFLICLIAFLLRLSSLINFISDNVLLGFKTGAALAIASTQLPKLFGMQGEGSNFIERIYNLVSHLPETNYTVLVFGTTALALLTLGNKMFPGRPVVLIIVVASIFVTTFSGLHDSGLKVVGIIPSGLPVFSFPLPGFSNIAEIFSLAMGCFLIGYIETISVARMFSDKYGYELNPRQELLSMGMANLAVAFFKGVPVSGGLSQSTINDKAGARTPFALIVCSMALSAILFWSTGLLKNLPEVILAVVVLDAVTGLIKIKEIKQLRSLSKTEYYIALIAVAGVLIFGILVGILISALISLAILLVRASYPNVTILGRIPGTDMFSDIQRHPDNKEISGCRIIRVETSIFYFNQQNIYNRITQHLQEVPGRLDMVVLDLSSAPNIDVSGAKMLLKLSKNLEERNITLKVVEALSEVRDLLRKIGLERVIGHISRKFSIHDVIDDFHSHTGS